MGELGVRIDTPISALLTLNEEFCCFSFRIHRFSRSFTLITALSTHTHAQRDEGGEEAPAEERPLLG